MKRIQIVGTILAGLILILFLGSCSEKQSPVETTTHPEGWNDVNSSLFHGAKVEEDGNTEMCQSCHGATLEAGGKSDVACTDCHNGGQVEKVTRHPARVREMNYDLTSCTICHGTDFRGKSGSASCRSAECHVRPTGPEACVTCHGDFEKTYTSGALTLADIAPPADLTGHTKPFYLGVGRHQFHLNQGMTCRACHVEDISSFDDPEHITGDGIAQLNSTFIKSWNRETATCTAICHQENGELSPKVWVIQ